MLRRLMLFMLGMLLVLGAATGAGLLAVRQGWVDLPGGLGDLGQASTRNATDATIVFSGRAGEFEAAKGNIVQEDTSVDPPAIWLRSGLRSASPAGATDGVSVEIPRTLVPRIEGRRIRVTVSARSGARGEPPPFAVAYSAGDRGNSGWIVFVPAGTMEDYSFTYTVPIGELSSSDNSHHVGIWSDINGGNAPLRVDRITIEPL